MMWNETEWIKTDDRMGRVTIEGVQYPMCLTIKATDAIEKRFQGVDKVSALLVSAYPSRTNMSLLDPRCDYIVDMGATLDGSQPSSSFDFVKQLFPQAYVVRCDFNQFVVIYKFKSLFKSKLSVR